MNLLMLTASIVTTALVAGAAHATSDFAVNWYSVDAGTAVESIGGTLVLNGVVGQPDSGPMLVGTTFEITGGFLAACATPIDLCPADFNGSSTVDAADLAILLSSWGPCAECGADISGDGIVSAPDLAELLSYWGPCIE